MGTAFGLPRFWLRLRRPPWPGSCAEGKHFASFLCDQVIHGSFVVLCICYNSDFFQVHAFSIAILVHLLRKSDALPHIHLNTRWTRLLS